MATSVKVLATLKQQLKQRGITYRQLAVALKLSESAVKHMFSVGNFSLKRLDEVCEVLELDMGQLVSLSEAQEPRIRELSAEYEAEIVADERLLLMAYCLINYWTLPEILERYDIPRADAFKYLRRLDQMKIVEVLPGDRVRLLIANNFAWRRNGAVERFFNQRVQTEFFRHNFRSDGALRIVRNGMLSKKAQLQLGEKLKSLSERFDEATWEERKIPAEEQYGTTMVLAIRQWTFEGFKKLER